MAPEQPDSAPLSTNSVHCPVTPVLDILLIVTGDIQSETMQHTKASQLTFFSFPEGFL